MANELSAAMRRELQAIAKTGEPGDLFDYYHAATLAFYARDRVLSALLRRELIYADDTGGFSLTDAGRAAIAKAAA